MGFRGIVLAIVARVAAMVLLTSKFLDDSLANRLRCSRHDTHKPVQLAI